MNQNYGMITGESNDAYHLNNAVSTSNIKDFLKRPMLFKAKCIDRTIQTKPTEAMEFGSAFHEYILEPDVFVKNYDCLPADYDGRTKAGKEIKAQMEESGKTIIKADTMAQIETLGVSINSNPVAKSLLSNGVAEVSWRINAGLFDMQSRTDWFVESANEEQVALLRKSGIEISVGQPIIVDLKTTQNIDEWFMPNYGNVIYKFGYQIQLGFYLAVVNKIRKEQGKEIVRHFLFVVVEKQEPNECAVIALNEESFGLAQTQLKDSLASLTSCYETGNWNAYSDRGVVIAGVPQQIITREEQDIFEKKSFVQSWLSGQ